MEKNDKFGSDIPFGLLQQLSVWYQWILSVSATTLSNNAALIVSLQRKYDHITPVLKDLHWLPVEYGINYKILLLAYKAQHGMAPLYLLSLLSPYKPGRSLRSEGKHLLRTPRYHLEGFGKRYFAHAAPSLWYMLPISIKCAQSIDTFKSSLKTHLFNVAYS